MFRLRDRVDTRSPEALRRPARRALLHRAAHCRVGGCAPATATSAAYDLERTHRAPLGNCPAGSQGRRSSADAAVARPRRAHNVQPGRSRRNT